MAKFFLYPFATIGDKTAIPDPTQSSGYISYENGFTDDYQKNLATGGSAKPIDRRQTNQLFYDITEAIRQYQTLGTPDFITSMDNGGTPFSYDIYARVRYNDGVNGIQVYESMVASNTAVPSDATKWRVISNDVGGVQPGTVIEFGGLVAPEGYLECDGSAYSRSTYAALFNATTMTQSGTLTNGAASVTGLTSTAKMRVGMNLEGTGIPTGTTIATIVDSTSVILSANATASGAQMIRFFAWANGDGSTTFNIPDDRRRATVGAGGTGTTVLANAPGAIGGEESHTQTISEMPAHNHPGSTVANNNPGDVMGHISVGDNTGPDNIPLNIAFQGSGNPFNIMQPSSVKMKCIKY